MVDSPIFSSRAIPACGGAASGRVEPNPLRLRNIEMRHILLLSGLLMLAGCTVLGIRDTAEPSFTTVDRLADAVEIRRYGPRAAAEVRLDGAAAGGGMQAQGRAFRTLFAYIQGANDGGRTIAMTAPVEQRSAGSSIAMTAPVETTTNADGFVMRFFLPDDLTAASAPEPTDPTVAIVELPASDVAVSRFTGWWSEASLARRQATLIDALDGTGWVATGPPVGWFYDPPWTIPFLRRNEVAVPVVPR